MRRPHPRLVAAVLAVTFSTGCSSLSERQAPETLRTEESREVRLILHGNRLPSGASREISLDAFEIRGDTIFGTVERFGTRSTRRYALADVAAVRFIEDRVVATGALVAGSILLLGVLVAHAMEPTFF